MRATAAIVRRVGLLGGALGVVLTLLCAAPFAAADSAAQLEAVRVWRAPDHTRVVLDMSAASGHKVFSLENPHRIVIDLQNATSHANLAAVDLHDSPVIKMRGAARAGGYRLVLDVQEKLQPKSFALAENSQYGHRLVVDLYDPAAQPIVVKTQDREQGKRDIVVAIDAGHGGEDPGASGPRRVREKNVVLEIAREMKKLLDAQRGYRAVLVRDGDYYVGLRKRRDLARQQRADLFISIHADAFKDKSVSGSSVYTLSQRGASSASARFLADSENKADRIGGVDLSGKDDLLASVLLDLSMTATLDASANVARAILDQLGGVVKLHKSTVEHAGFAVLKSPDIPSVLIETGFISNPREAKRLSSSAHQKELARATVAGVVNHYARNAAEGTWVYWQRQQSRGVALASGDGVTRAVSPPNNKPKPLAPPRSHTYKIKSGDTLSEVALRYSVSLRELRRYNRLNSDKIRVGQVIKIPPRS